MTTTKGLLTLALLASSLAGCRHNQVLPPNRPPRPPRPAAAFCWDINELPVRCDGQEDVEIVHSPNVKFTGRVALAGRVGLATHPQGQP